MSNNASLSITNALDEYLATEAASAYLVADTAITELRDIRRRLQLALRELADAQQRERDTADEFAILTDRHNATVMDHERLRNENNTLNRMVILTQGQNDRYRRHLETVTRRTIPPSFEPILRRVRESENGRSIRRRITFEDDNTDTE